MKLKRFTRITMLLAFSVVLNIIESFIPLVGGSIPGLKLGLANVVILIVLYLFSFKEAVYISILRVILVGILRTGLFSMTFFFSLGGVLLSVVVMYLVKKTKLSIVGVSILGSIAHSFGQVIIAMLLMKNIYIFYYVPWLLLFAVPAGILTGLISKKIIKNLESRLQ